MNMPSVLDVQARDCLVVLDTLLVAQLLAG